jgi:hypothetical protein
VEADFTVGFEGTSLGHRLSKDPVKDEAALCACFVPTQLWRAVRSVKGLR